MRFAESCGQLPHLIFEKRGQNGAVRRTRCEGGAFRWHHQRLLRWLHVTGRTWPRSRQGDRWHARREHRLLASPRERGRSCDRQQLVRREVRQRPQRTPLRRVALQTLGMSINCPAFLGTIIICNLIRSQTKPCRLIQF